MGSRICGPEYRGVGKRTELMNELLLTLIEWESWFALAEMLVLVFIGSTVLKSAGKMFTS